MKQKLLTALGIFSLLLILAVFAAATLPHNPL